MLNLTFLGPNRPIKATECRLHPTKMMTNPKKMKKCRQMKRKVRMNTTMTTTTRLRETKT